MSDVIELAGSPLGIRFIIQWNGVTALAITLPTVTTGILVILGTDFDYSSGNLVSGDLFLYLIAASFLLFPILGAFGQGWVMRSRLKHPVLWATLTGGGIVAAFVILSAVAATLDRLWRPVAWQLAIWIERALSLRAPPSALVAYAGAGLLFGLVLGGIQAGALDHGWGSRLRWIAVSAAAGLPAAVWLYVCVEVDAVANGLLLPIAESLPLPGHWNTVPMAVPVAIILCLCFTLPTGLLMERLLHRRRRASAEALVRRFE